MRGRWPFYAAAFATLGTAGACAAFMASPPPPPPPPTYQVCRAAGFHGYAVECFQSFEPPGVVPGTFAPGQGPTATTSPRAAGRASSATTDNAPGFQGTPDVGAADVGIPSEGAAQGD